MKILKKCRTPSGKKSSSLELLLTMLALALGCALGILSKWLDELTITEGMVFEDLLEILDLRNVFSRISVWALAALIISVRSRTPLRASVNTVMFLGGMIIGYYGYTIIFSGFFPAYYMAVWSVLAVLSSIPAYFSWYSKGTGTFSIVMSAFILGFFASQAFYFGRWYFGLHEWDSVICFFAAAAVLYSKPKPFLLSLVGACIAAPVIDWLTPYIFGGL